MRPGRLGALAGFSAISPLRPDVTMSSRRRAGTTRCRRYAAATRFEFLIRILHGDHSKTETKEIMMLSDFVAAIELAISQT